MNDVLIRIAAVLGSAMLIVALLVVGERLTWRRHRRMREMLAARGMRIIGIRISAKPPMGDLVQFIGPEGEVREGLIVRGEKDFRNHRPIQEAWKEEYENGRNELMRSLRLAAHCPKLPGWEEFTFLTRQLATGAIDRITIHEFRASSDAQQQLMPIVQCLEVMTIDSKSSDPHALELSVDGKNIHLHWSLEGTAPNRSLTVNLVGTKADGEKSMASSNSAP